MKKRMSMFGVGPKIGLFGLVYSFIIILLNYYFKELFYISVTSNKVLNILAVVMLLIGVPFYVISGKTLTKIYKMDILYTKGVYSFCRHPLYTAVIIFILPGILLFFHSWILLSIPVVMLLICSFIVKKEDMYLAERYPDEYPSYVAKVGSFFPKIEKIFWIIRVR